MQLLRKYQLDIISLFFALLVIVWLFFNALEYFGVDPHNYEWYLAGPLLLLYVIWLGRIRNHIRLSERRALTGKTLFYWLALGIALFSSYSTPIAARDYWSLNALFVVFTLLLADSYWDFKQICWRSIWSKKENGSL